MLPGPRCRAAKPSAPGAFGRYSAIVIDLPAQPAPTPRTCKGPLLDPGWLFLIAGLVLLTATVLIPAYDDLDDARLYLKRAQAAEDHRIARLERHRNYIDALDRGDEALILSLAAMQLNKAPLGTLLLQSGGDPSTRSASVFPALEPPPLVLPTKQDTEQSMLHSLATGDLTRLGLIGFSSLCILIGLLPPTRRASA